MDRFEIQKRIPLPKLKIGFVWVSLMVVCWGLAAVPGAAGARKKAYTIQVIAYSSLARTKVHVKRLQQSGLDAFYQATTTRTQKKLYRVSIGRFPSIRDAKQQALLLKKRNKISDYFIRAVAGTPAAVALQVQKKGPAKQPAAPPSSKTAAKNAAGQQPVPPVSAPRTDPGGLQIQSVTYANTPEGAEIVMVRANQRFHPHIRFALDQPEPHLMVLIAGAGTPSLPVAEPNGRCIKRIRPQAVDATMAKGQPIRVIVDLQPGRFFDITQRFEKDENVFVVEIGERKTVTGSASDSEV